MIIDYLNGKGKETNCHGCKWLDNVNNKGEGYCCQVVRSQTYKSGDKVRHQEILRRLHLHASLLAGLPVRKPLVGERRTKVRSGLSGQDQGGA